MSPLEHRYRRVLRLLPDGYRQLWEEDMVSTFLASTDRGGGARKGRPALAERMSVLALAVRLRLGATRPVTEVRLRHRVLYCVALMALLYLALVGTSTTVSTVNRFVLYTQGELQFRGSDAYFVTTTAGAGLLGLLWVVAFWNFVHGRFAVPQLVMLVTLGASVAAVGMSVAEFVDSLVGALSAISALVFLAAFAWFTTTAFRVPADSHTPRPQLWLGGYLVAAVALTVTQALRYVLFDRWLPYLDPTMLARMALLTAMAAALATPAGRRRADWLFALAIVAGVLALLFGDPFGSTESMALSVISIVLALACALRARVAARTG